jgi:hypothetical protein
MGGIYYKLGNRLWNGVIWDYRVTLVSRVVEVRITQNAMNSWIRRGKPTRLYELVIRTSEGETAERRGE